MAEDDELDDVLEYERVLAESIMVVRSSGVYGLIKWRREANEGWKAWWCEG